MYLSGLVPASDEGELSRHLRSRLEVERALGARGVPVTTLHAGIILGAGGASFSGSSTPRRAPAVHGGPRWTRSQTQAIDQRDVVALLSFALDHPELAGKAYDVALPRFFRMQSCCERQAE